jgi:mersacidin/lichenicidin family type 2 lantibiotic
MENPLLMSGERGGWLPVLKFHENLCISRSAGCYHAPRANPWCGARNQPRTRRAGMSKEMIIRAWKDPSFRATLSEAELAALPANPAGGREFAPSALAAHLDSRAASNLSTNMVTSYLPSCCL